MPIVGTPIRSVIQPASRCGMDSSTIANAPALSRASAPSTTALAPFESLPCARYPPSSFTDCGVSPTCPITGIPAVVIASTRPATSVPPCEFDGLHAPFLDHSRRRGQRLLGGYAEGHERQIADKQRVAGRPRDGPRVVNHVVERYAGLGVESKNVSAHAVAHENHVDPGFVHNAPCRRVVRRDHNQLVTRLLFSPDVPGRHPHRNPPPLPVAGSSTPHDAGGLSSPARAARLRFRRIIVDPT